LFSFTGIKKSEEAGLRVQPAEYNNIVLWGGSIRECAKGTLEEKNRVMKTLAKTEGKKVLGRIAELAGPKTC